MEKIEVMKGFKIQIPQQILDKLKIKTGNHIVIKLIDEETMSFRKTK